MKTTLIAATLGLLATAAAAQSSVTIFGNIDADIAHYQLNGVR